MPYAPLLTEAAIASALADLPDWTRDGEAISRSVRCASFREAIALVNAVADAAEAADHHPDTGIVWRRVTFRLTSKASGGLTQRDIALASEIDSLVAGEAKEVEGPGFLPNSEIARRLAEIPSWTRDRSAIERILELESFEAAADFLAEIASAIAPTHSYWTVTVRGRSLQLRLTHLSHSGSGLTDGELRAAAVVDRLWAGRRG